VKLSQRLFFGCKGQRVTIFGGTKKKERAQIRMAICKQARIRDEVRFAPLRVRACVKDRYMPHLFHIK